MSSFTKLDLHSVISGTRLNHSTSLMMIDKKKHKLLLKGNLHSREHKNSHLCWGDFFAKEEAKNEFKEDDWVLTDVETYSDSESPEGYGEARQRDSELYHRTPLKILWSSGKCYWVYLKYGSRVDGRWSLWWDRTYLIWGRYLKITVKGMD
jgi:hypothetical protein